MRSRGKRRIFLGLFFQAGSSSVQYLVPVASIVYENDRKERKKGAVGGLTFSLYSVWYRRQE